MVHGTRNRDGLAGAGTVRCVTGRVGCVRRWLVVGNWDDRSDRNHPPAPETVILSYFTRY